MREGVALCLLLATAVVPGWILQSRWIALSCLSMTLGPKCPQVAAGRLFIIITQCVWVIMLHVYKECLIVSALCVIMLYNYKESVIVSASVCNNVEYLQ